MTPDKGFRKQLKKLHSEFEIVWDWGANKWEIWQCPKEVGREASHVLTVQTEGKSYRELGADILLSLQQTLAWQHLSAKQICDYLDELDNQERRRKAKEFKSKIDAITNETYDFARGVIKLQVPRNFSLGRAVSNEESREVSTQ